MDNQLLPTDELIACCRDELDAIKDGIKDGKKNNPAPCLEIYYRAFHEDDEDAVKYVLHTISKMINNQLEASAIFNEIFTNPGNIANFRDNFTTYPEFKSWFNLKVKTALRDVKRREERREREVVIDGIAETHGHTPNLQKNVENQEVWEVLAQVFSEDDIEFLKLRYVKGFSPAELVAEYPDKFPNERYVYGHLYYVLTQIRQNKNLLNKLTGNA